MSETISPNTTIAQYTILSKIGAGGMGEVWRARDARLAREVAIKILPAKLSHDQDRLKRRDGKELFYIASDGKLMSVEIKTDGGFKPGIPKALFDVAVSGRSRVRLRRITGRTTIFVY